ncbi:hypothetical protein OG394_36945 [Kribbella sp. NBC_01245]|uniref:hypothetical protein n=1 Tax=Kribbella sp. NBC_01245 TaxID=2903578 RepID=UPI002E2B1DCC|nr:hypothetical protein [Kribbella sp. NBC_01245]
MTKSRRQRNLAVALVIAWALVVVVAWWLGMGIAPGDRGLCGSKAFDCDADIQFNLFLFG